MILISLIKTIVGSKRMLENANWARYNLAVSLRKESEPESSSMWNLHLPGAPTVDFHRFFDGENISQQDLVAWINVGMHHLVRVLVRSSCLRYINQAALLVSISPKPRIPPTPKPPSQLPGTCPRYFSFSLFSIFCNLPTVQLRPHASKLFRL
jgi:hypothetical protein